MVTTYWTGLTGVNWTSVTGVVKIISRVTILAINKLDLQENTELTSWHISTVVLLTYLGNQPPIHALILDLAWPCARLRVMQMFAENETAEFASCAYTLYTLRGSSSLHVVLVVQMFCCCWEIWRKEFKKFQTKTQNHSRMTWIDDLLQWTRKTISWPLT